MRISDWSSDVCSSDLPRRRTRRSCEDSGCSPCACSCRRLRRSHRSSSSRSLCREIAQALRRAIVRDASAPVRGSVGRMWIDDCFRIFLIVLSSQGSATATFCGGLLMHYAAAAELDRSEEHTSELQSLMRLSYDVFCLQNKNQQLN